MAEVTVEVVVALADRQRLLRLSLPAGSDARAAVLASGLQDEFPELDLAQAPLGLFGKRLPAAERHVLEEGDRIEVYRPLLADPKEVRRRRAERAREAR